MNLHQLFLQLNNSCNYIPLDPSVWPTAWDLLMTKNYSRFPTTPLPKAEPLPHIPLNEILTKRRSQRQLGAFDISPSKLSSLLKYSVGTICDPDELVHHSKSSQVQRHYPSAGSRYPIETYVSIKQNTHFPDGLYYYNYLHHTLHKLFSKAEFDHLTTAMHITWAQNASLIIMLTINFNRVAIKYLDSAYNLSLIELGIVNQNISLVATAMDIQHCINYSLHRDEIEALYDLNEDEVVGNIIAFGRNQ